MYIIYKKSRFFSTSNGQYREFDERLIHVWLFDNSLDDKDFDDGNAFGKI